MNVSNNEIKKVTLLYPEIMSEDAESYIKNLITEIKELEQKSSEYFMLKEETDNKLRNLQDKLKNLLPLFNIEYETKDIKYICNGCSVMIKESNGVVHI